MKRRDVLKPWRKAMWCVGHLTAQHRERMYALCELYARPYDPEQPVVGADEKSKELLACTRPALEAHPGQIAKEDYAYARRGTSPANA